MENMNHLFPQPGSWVTADGMNEPGVVEKVQRNHDGYKVLVCWLKSKKREFLPPDKLRNGFLPGMEVQDIPTAINRMTLGEGVVVATRAIGGQDQVLVEFPNTGKLCWLPFQNLKQIKGIAHRFELGQTGEDGNAERFRLRCLAHALEMWNENTGSLSRLDIDPLPHQIHLVHHILASGNLNWLVADDVGLGKTIEVGMLLSALSRRPEFRRVLLVTPAGLVKQWKDELHYKFGMSDYVIYGEDFYVNDPRHWKLYDHVIGSVDRLKSEDHLEALLQGGNWDLVVFDEAHRLSRSQTGRRYRSSGRFRLAAALRRHTASLLLLTATPHQGKQDKFQALLELIRPEFKEEIQSLSLNPSIIKHMVLRNHKADVTDVDGNFIFRGKTTNAVQVDLAEEEREFDDRLVEYLIDGYAAGNRVGGKEGRAIGFVMNIYRKLAASSIAAIEKSLTRRRRRLVEESRSEIGDPEGLEQADERFIGEWEESFESSGREFFSGEIRLLKKLLEKARCILKTDHKIKSFLDELVKPILERNSDERILIFTEYRATQDHVAGALRRNYGDQSVHLIHGGQTHSERSASITKFEDHGQFLISTEAGGEGINLHRKCHIMVNYDLPWNPMRLVQRLGRLYRYGQKHRVVVFNLQVPQTMDGKILRLLYERIDQVVQDLSGLGTEFQPGLEAEILGELVGMLDIERVLERAATEDTHRTREQVDDALKRAKEALEMQRELLEFAASYDPEDSKYELKLEPDHAGSFIQGMIRQLGIELTEISHKGSVMRLRLPDTLAHKLGMKGHAIRITLNRDIAANRPDIQMMDLESALFKELLTHAKTYGFDGRVAKVGGLDCRAVVTAMLRWQNDQGNRMRQEYSVFTIGGNGSVQTNPPAFLEWMLNPVKEGLKVGDRDQGRRIVELAKNAMDQRLGNLSNADLHPENRQLVSAAWC